MKTTSAILPPVSLLPIAALLASACVDPGEIEPADESVAAVSLADQGGGFSRAHLMPMPDEKRRARSFAAAKGGYNFTYRGGPVISHAKVFTIFWGDGVPLRTQIDGFYQGVTQSAHMDWLDEYDTPSQPIRRGTFAGSLVDHGIPQGDDLGDRQIQKEITRLVRAGAVPPPDADMLYMLHFPARVSITMDGSQSCQQFCAYHGSFQLDGKNVYYGVMPEVSGGCASCGGTDDKLQNTTIIASHELIEAITDPGVGLANSQNETSWLAWYDDDHGEVGDVCQSESGVVDGWAVQAEYSMVAGQCVITRGGGVGPACTHGVCVSGSPLRADCGPCTQKICAAAPACCQSRWDASCVQKAVDLCGKNCQ